MEPGDTLRATYAVVSGGKWGCKTCGFTNSPQYGELEVGVAIHGDATSATLPRYSELIDPSGQSWDVKFDHGQLFATGGGTAIGQYDLVGWTLRAKWPWGEVRDAEIYAFDWVLDWTDDGGAIPTYGLSYFDPITEDTGNICEGMLLDETSVVFLEGERYEADGTIVPNQHHLVTAACRGHALAKMALTKYVPYDGATDVDERQATLRMFRADYCGDGTSYTVLGTKIDFTDDGARRHVEFNPELMSEVLEAYWNQDGAICLGTPRWSGVGEIPCEPPPCEEFFGGGFEGAWASLVP